MQFAFSRRYRFECEQCGVCCLQKALSLTDTEYERLKGVLAHSHYQNVESYHLTPDIHMNDVSFKGKDCYFVKKSNKKRICGIYESRFTTCRLYPLSVTGLPNGELLVNLIHCNGVSLQQGKIVNESFVKSILDDVNAVSPSFLPKLVEYKQSYHNYPFPFYTNIDFADFWIKRDFLKKILEWFLKKSPRSKSIDVRIEAINEVLSRELSMRLQELFDEYRLTQPPLVLTQIDVEKITDELERGLENKLCRISEDAESVKREEVNKIFSKKKAEILVGENPKMFDLDEETAYFSPHLDKIKVRVKSLFTEKPLSKDAVELLEDYTGEILNRVDHGGFSMEVPIIDMLESLLRLARSILVYARVYSQKGMKIQKSHMNDAIVYLDTRYTLKSICNRVIAERAHQRRPLSSG